MKSAGEMRAYLYSEHENTSLPCWKKCVFDVADINAIGLSNATELQIH